MSYEDLVTIKAFLMALESLDQPLPESVQADLGVIVQALPESAYELHDLAERYEPLNQEYLAVLQDFPGEGERLKFVPSEITTENGNEPNPQSTEVEILIQQLHRQLQRVYSQKQRSPLLTKDLGWTPEQIIEARSRLLSFEEDWNAPGMEIYDDL
jgi:hypothetical protein